MQKYAHIPQNSKQGYQPVLGKNPNKKSALCTVCEEEHENSCIINSSCEIKGKQVPSFGFELY